MYEKCSTRGCDERLMQYEAKLSAVFASRHPLSAVLFIRTSISSTLIAILYFLVVWLGATFLSGQIFSHQDISECLGVLILAVGRSSKISFSKELWRARDDCAV